MYNIISICRDLYLDTCPVDSLSSAAVSLSRCVVPSHYHRASIAHKASPDYRITAVLAVLQIVCAFAPDPTSWSQHQERSFAPLTKPSER